MFFYVAQCFFLTTQNSIWHMPRTQEIPGARKNEQMIKQMNEQTSLEFLPEGFESLSFPKALASSGEKDLCGEPGSSCYKNHHCSRFGLAHFFLPRARPTRSALQTIQSLE